MTPSAARPRRHRRRRRGLAALGSVAAAGFVALTLAGPGRAAPASAAATTTTSSTTTTASTASPVSLEGEGTYDVDGELLGWQDALYGKHGTIDLDYLSEGGEAGRGDLLAGTIDYAISGAPFTASELKSYKAGASGIIAAPIMPSAVGFLLEPPTGGFYVINGQTGDASAEYSGPVREPAENVVAQALHYVAADEPIPAGSRYAPYAGATGTPYTEWDNPSIVSTWDSSFVSGYDPGEGDTFEPYLTSPQQVTQAEPNEDNLYLDEWAEKAAPTVWKGLKQVLDPDPSASDPFVASELPQPTLAVTEKPGLPETLQAVESGSVTSNQNLGGILAPVPPSSEKVARAAQADTEAACEKDPPAGGVSFCQETPVEWIEVPNAKGQWEAPTPAAIDAAIDASPAPAPTATSGVTPLWATTHKVSGGYPLTYVDYLYAPAKGLSVDDTEALATVIRYLATDGQDQLAANGDGRLSHRLVAQALTAANDLVRSDCPAAGGEVVLSSAPSRYAPDLPGIKSLGAVDHCDPAGTVTTPPTTAAPTATAPPVTAAAGDTGSSASTPSSSPSSPSAPSSSRPAARTTSMVPARRTGPSRPAAGSRHPAPLVAETASALPLAVVSGNEAGLDKLAALAVGVVGYLLLRRRVAAVLRRIVGG